MREAERPQRSLGKPVIVEPARSFGSPGWKPGVARLAAVPERMGIRLAEVRAYAVDAGTGMPATVGDSGRTLPQEDIETRDCERSA
ncbi:MAG TPA: hypothetical protein VH482_14540 [Thermomicrobiales bacterium]